MINGDCRSIGQKNIKRYIESSRIVIYIYVRILVVVGCGVGMKKLQLRLKWKSILIFERTQYIYYGGVRLARLNLMIKYGSCLVDKIDSHNLILDG